MKITKLELNGAFIIEPTYFEDDRGYYCETYSKRTLENLKKSENLEYLNLEFVQDNHSLSLKKGTLRGIHFQNNPKAQSKLVRCTSGKIMDYIIDLRKNSSTYKNWQKIELTAENRKQLFIPKGFGHAFLTLEDNCELLYKTDELYFPEYERSILWNDPDLNIDWQVKESNIIMSDKDKNGSLLSKCDINF